MGKEQFIQIMGHLKQYWDKEVSIYNDTHGILDLVEFQELYTVIDDYIALIAYAMQCKDYDDLGYNDISYFIYELKWGKNGDKYPITVNNIDYYLKTIEDLYDFILITR